MRTVQLLVFGLLVCQTTESLTNKRVNFGANVTLECQIDIKDIYWVFQKLTDCDTANFLIRIYIISCTRPKTERQIFNINRLFISNVSTDELGTYYCVKTGPFLQLSDGIRLYVVEAAQNQTEPNRQLQHQTTQQALIVLYIILNIVMFSAVIGLFQIKLQVCKKRHQQCQDEELEQLYSRNDKEFSEVDFCLFHPTNNTFFPFQNPKTNIIKNK